MMHILEDVAASLFGLVVWAALVGLWCAYVTAVGQ